jgi:hypothetical protein
MQCAFRYEIAAVGLQQGQREADIGLDLDVGFGGIGQRRDDGMRDGRGQLPEQSHWVLSLRDE